MLIQRQVNIPLDLKAEMTTPCSLTFVAHDIALKHDDWEYLFLIITLVRHLTILGPPQMEFWRCKIPELIWSKFLPVLSYLKYSWIMYKPQSKVFFSTFTFIVEYNISHTIREAAMGKIYHVHGFKLLPLCITGPLLTTVILPSIVYTRRISIMIWLSSARKK